MRFPSDREPGAQHTWRSVLTEVPEAAAHPPVPNSAVVDWTSGLETRNRQSAGLLLTALEAWAEPRLRVELRLAATVSENERRADASMHGESARPGSQRATDIIACFAFALVLIAPILSMDDIRNPGHFIAALGAPTAAAGILAALAMGALATIEAPRPRRPRWSPLLYLVAGLWNLWGLWTTWSRVTGSESAHWSAPVVLGSALSVLTTIGLAVIFIAAKRSIMVEDATACKQVGNDCDRRLRLRVAEISAAAADLDRPGLIASVVPGIRVLFERGVISREQAVWMLGELCSAHIRASRE